MPKKFLPQEDQIQELFRSLAFLGFHQMADQDLEKDFQRLGLEEPRFQEGREIRFSYTNNHYECLVLTTILSSFNNAAISDAAWVIVRTRDKKVFTSPRLHRTKYFVLRVIAWAEIGKALCDYRPLCPECNGYMDIERGKQYREYFWEHAHRDGNQKMKLFEPLYQNLSLLAQSFYERYQMQLRSYQKKLRAKGLEAGRAAKARRLWNIQRPENVK